MATNVDWQEIGAREVLSHLSVMTVTPTPVALGTVPLYWQGAYCSPFGGIVPHVTDQERLLRKVQAELAAANAKLAALEQQAAEAVKPIPPPAPATPAKPAFPLRALRHQHQHVGLFTR